MRNLFPQTSEDVPLLFHINVLLSEDMGGRGRLLPAPKLYSYRNRASFLHRNYRRFLTAKGKSENVRKKRKRQR
jgi:hypothetical protein